MNRQASKILRWKNAGSRRRSPQIAADQRTRRVDLPNQTSLLLM
jgi:hypothetical protein